MSAVAAVGLAVWGGYLVRVQPDDYWWSADLATAVMVGLLATPLAPLSKDLMSSLQAAVKVVSAAKR